MLRVNLQNLIIFFEKFSTSHIFFVGFAISVYHEGQSVELGYIANRGQGNYYRLYCS